MICALMFVFGVLPDILPDTEPDNIAFFYCNNDDNLTVLESDIKKSLNITSRTTILKFCDSNITLEDLK